LLIGIVVAIFFFPSSGELRYDDTSDDDSGIEDGDE